MIETGTSGVKGNIWFLWSVFEKQAVGVWNRRACRTSDAYGCLVVWGSVGKDELAHGVKRWAVVCLLWNCLCVGAYSMSDCETENKLLLGV